MRTAAEFVYSTLRGLPSFEILVLNSGGSGPWWEVAETDATYPLVSFNLAQEMAGTSKEDAGIFTLTLTIFDNSAAPMSQAGNIAEAIQADLRAQSSIIKLVRSESGYTDDERRAGYIEAVYTFRLQQRARKVVITGSGADYSGTILLDDGKIQIPVTFDGSGVAYASIPAGAYSVAFAASELLYSITTENISLEDDFSQIQVGINKEGAGEF